MLGGTGARMRFRSRHGRRPGGCPGERGGRGLRAHRDSVTPLAGAVPAEQADEEADGRRPLGRKLLARHRASLAPERKAGWMRTEMMPPLA